MRLLIALAVAATAASVGAPAAAQQPDVRTVVDGVEFPTGIAFHPDGRMFFNERPGRIRVVEDGRLVDAPVAQIPTATFGETGLLGIDVSPDRDSLYVFATESDGASNTVWRVAIEGGETERLIRDLPASQYHNGGGVAFDSDGLLLVSNGERHEGELAQDADVLGGKVYRFGSNGRPASGNPFGGGPAYAIGLRNPYGITIDPVGGAPFVTENGPESFDEVNRVEAGWNLGWPDISGPRDGGSSPAGPGEYHDPVASYEQIVVPTGLAFADPEDADQRFAGDLFVGTYGEQAIHRLQLNEARTAAVEDEIFYRSDEPIVALEWGPEGLYFSTPTAIKLLAIGGRAGGGQPEPTPTETEASPSPTPSPSLPPRELDPGGTVVFLVVAGILAFGVIYTLRRGRALRPRD